MYLNPTVQFVQHFFARKDVDTILKQKNLVTDDKTLLLILINNMLY